MKVISQWVAYYCDQQIHNTKLTYVHRKSQILLLTRPRYKNFLCSEIEQLANYASCIFQDIFFQPRFQTFLLVWKTLTKLNPTMHEVFLQRYYLK